MNQRNTQTLDRRAGAISRPGLHYHEPSPWLGKHTRRTCDGFLPWPCAMAQSRENRW